MREFWAKVQEFYDAGPARRFWIVYTAGILSTLAAQVVFKIFGWGG